MKQDTALAGIVGLVHNQREERIKGLARQSLATLRIMQDTATKAARRAYYGGDTVAYERYDQRLNELIEAVLRKEFNEEA